MLITVKPTVPCSHHVIYYKVNEANLWLWNGARVSVEHWHYHWQLAFDLFVCLYKLLRKIQKHSFFSLILFSYLGEILLSYTFCPFNATAQGPCGIGYVSAFDHHSLNQSYIFRQQHHIHVNGVGIYLKYSINFSF